MVVLSYQNVLSSMIELADEDGKITSEEKNIIVSVNSSLKELDTAFSNIISLFSEDKLNEYLHQAKQKVLLQAHSTALKDQNISLDEQSLLDLLQEELDLLEISFQNNKMTNENFFLFKIVLEMQSNEQYMGLLEYLDAAYCNRKQIPDAGICLGTKKLVIYDDDTTTQNNITFLIFTADDRLPEARKQWLQKGAFATENFPSHGNLDTFLETIGVGLIKEFYHKRTEALH